MTETMKAYCYDHRETLGESALSDKWKRILKESGLEIVQDQPSDVIVVHDSSTRVSYLEDGSPTWSDLPGFQYALLCSTAGVPLAPKEHRSNKKLVIAFGVQPNCDVLTDSEWGAVLSWLVEVAKKRCKSIIAAEDIAPREIRNLIRPPDLAHAAALAILCQGYLVAYAVKNKRIKDENAIKKALKKMDWPEFCKSGDLSQLEKRTSANWRAANQRAWWSVFELDFVDEATFLRSISVKPGTTHQAICELIAEVRSDKEVQPTTVAKAYLEIEPILESRP